MKTIFFEIFPPQPPTAKGNLDAKHEEISMLGAAVKRREEEVGVGLVLRDSGRRSPAKQSLIKFARAAF